MPDVEIKPQVYKDPRPKEAFDRYHALVRDHEPESKVYEIVRICTVVWALLAYRARGFGTENVPNGPVILAPNHASFMDHFFTGAFIRRRVQFMGKSQLFKGIGAWVFSHGGGWRLDHIFASEELEPVAAAYHHAWRDGGLSDHSALETDFSVRFGAGVPAPETGSRLRRPRG